LFKVGSGPYQLVSAENEEVLFLGNQLVNTVKFVYQTNPNYRDLADLYFQRVELKGGGTAVEAASSVLEFGDVDFAYNLQLEGDELEAMLAAGNNQGQLVNSLGGRVEYLTLIQNDPTDATFSKPHPFFSTEADPTNEYVVQAIAHAINREPILALYGVTGEEAQAIIMDPPPFRSDNVYYPYDLDKARELLALAGWVDENGDGVVEKDGRDLSITFRTSQNTVRQETQNIIREALNEIGIDVELDVSGQFFTTNASLPNGWLSGTADIIMYTEGNQVPDPTSYLGNWQCGQLPKVDSNNVWQGRNNPRWCSEAYDALYEQVKVETDPELRQALFKQLNDTLVEDVIVIPLVGRARISGATNEIAGIDLTPWDSHLWNVHEWRRVSTP
jgi:peptide/nickel transport system substrate-binding protein